MIKQILNRLPRNKALPDGNDIEGRTVEAAFNSCNSSENSFAQSKEKLVITSAASSLPLSDTNISNVGLNVAPVRVGITESNTSSQCLPLFRDVPISERPSLFVSKLSLCSNAIDFRDPTKSWKEKDIKKQTLLELVDFISAGNMKIIEQVTEEVTKMVAANLFRTLPPSFHENTYLESFDMEEEEPTLEPAWPHLQVVYEFLFRFLTLADIDPKIAKLYIDQSFILKILELFDSEDSRERDYLKTILHRIYGKFKFHRPFIRRAVNNIFYRFIFETERHNGIAELLEIWGSIVNGFALPLKEEHKLVLERALIPLHKAKCVSMYHRQLCYCMTQFVEKDVKLASTVIRGLLKYWPITNSRKEVMFLGELEEILEATQPDEFQQCMVPLFRRLAGCLNCPHFQVAERALFLWNNDHIVDLVTPNCAVLLPIIFPALDENMNSHWNQVIYGMTMNARKLFMEMDQELFEQCKRTFKEEESRRVMLMEKQTLIWQRLELAASANHDRVK